MPSEIPQQVIDELNATQGVVASAIVFINGTAARIQAAVDAAIANGATAEQLAPVTEELAEMRAKRQELADAIAANP